MFCIMNTVNEEQKLAALMVILYLMGWRDVKTSHTCSTVLDIIHVT